MAAPSVQKLWGGRFSGGTDPVMEEFNASMKLDDRLWAEDLEGSRVYAAGLAKAGIVTEEERCALTEGLDKVAQEWSSGVFKVKETDEDIHTANERRLVELIGSVGGKLHTGRSRNDQVMTDIKLWLKKQVDDFKALLRRFIMTFIERAGNEIDILMPGYTHLQRAQPIRWSHWLLSHAWSLLEDLERLEDLTKRVDVMPLGSGAIAGNPFRVDRRWMADLLGFSAISYNSMAAVGDRGFVAEYLFWASLLSCHLSRLAEDVIIFASQEFGFITLSDTYSTGSSLMAQKRNPDSMELVRGKTGTLFGKLAGFMMTIKALPSTYNKDLQEDKQALFDTTDSLRRMLLVAMGTVSTLKVNVAACQAALSPAMLSTDLAYYLVRKGLAFRDSHWLVGKVVAAAESRKLPIPDLPLETLSEISPLFTDDVTSVWNMEASVEQYQATGGTSKVAVREQLKEMEHRIGSMPPLEVSEK